MRRHGSALLALLIVAASTGAQVPGALVPVTDAMLQNPDPADWLMWRRTLDLWGHSPLTEIDRSNVGDLKMVWTRALGPGIRLCAAAAMRDLPIVLAIERDGSQVFGGETRTAQIKRDFTELAAYLVRELSFPHGAFLLTGTGIVPGEDFTLQGGDVVRITIGGLVLENHVE